MSETIAFSGLGQGYRRRLAVLLPAAFLLGFAVFALRAFSPPDPPLRETDGIVVLTGGSERVATGLRLLTEGLAPRLLISGAHPEVGLADIAQAAGIDPAPVARQVTIGRAAATTRGNAVETHRARHHVEVKGFCAQDFR